MKHNPGFLTLVNEAKARVQEIDIEEYQKLPREGHLLIDVREDHEWAAGHAAGAIHLSKGIIERDIETRVPDPSTKMVLYCGGGYRSALVADALRHLKQILEAGEIATIDGQPTGKRSLLDRVAQLVAR